jgi:hypothetical protein
MFFNLLSGHCLDFFEVLHLLLEPVVNVNEVLLLNEASVALVQVQLLREKDGRLVVRRAVDFQNGVGDFLVVVHQELVVQFFLREVLDLRDVRSLLFHYFFL